MITIVILQSLLRLWPRIVAVLIIAVIPGLLFASNEAKLFDVILKHPEQPQSYPIAILSVTQSGSGVSRYQVEMNEDWFGDYFLSMRPFKCMTDSVNMLCHLAYPYSLKRQFSKKDFSALEHDFLFIRRSPNEYGINPWNGLYFRIQVAGDGYLGKAYEVDLNILAAPPETDDLPLLEAEMYEADPDNRWLTELLITPR